jgi:hypothetical protein
VNIIGFDNIYRQLRFFIIQYIHTYEYIHTYHSRFIVAEVSQIFLRDTHALPKLVSYEEHCRHDRWLAHHRLTTVYFRCKCLLLFTTSMEERERGPILLFYPEHYTRLYLTLTQPIYSYLTFKNCKSI